MKKRSLNSIVDDIDIEVFKKAKKERESSINTILTDKTLSSTFYEIMKKKRTQIENYVFEEFLEYVVDLLVSGCKVHEKNITGFLLHLIETSKSMYNIIKIEIDDVDIIMSVYSKIKKVMKSKISNISFLLKFESDTIKKNITNIYMTITF